ncbi:MAG: hypothetical protein WBO37_13315 [Gammaproteobacteria bacterium]
MKYSSVVIAVALALSGMAYAANESNATGDNEADADKKAKCITDFIASGLEDDQKEKYLADCMQGTADKSLGGE